MEFATILPGVLTGVAALIAAFAAILKNNSNKAAKNESHEEVTSDTVDLIEKIVDSQMELNKILSQEIVRQKAELSQEIARQKEEIDNLKHDLMLKDQESSENGNH